MGSLSISDMAKSSHLGIKALRHYHRIGLLVPDEVDELTGYRRYAPEQVADALVIKRLRDLDMPLEKIGELIATGDADRRGALLREQLDLLIAEMGRLRSATERLDELLTPRALWPEISQRATPPLRGVGIRGTVEAATALVWLQGVMGELGATVRQAGVHQTGPPVGAFDDAIFTDGAGEGILMVPCEGPVRLVGRVEEISLPAVELCVAVHRGPVAGIERAYAAVGEHVGRHEIAVPGPLREIYLVGPLETRTEADWVTEVGWPVLHTRSGDPAGVTAAGQVSPG